MKELSKAKTITLIALFGALAAVLMFFEFSLPFIAPTFYEIDLSEIPVIIGTFMMGPVAGVIIEALKILIKIIIKGTSTGYVGELANFCVGCAFVVPAGIAYKIKKTKVTALVGMMIGTIVMAVAGIFLNYFIMIPFYENFMPLDAIIQAGAAINPLIKTKLSFVIVAVAPFNIVKGIIITVITMLVYKRISAFIRGISLHK